MSAYTTVMHDIYTIWTMKELWRTGASKELDSTTTQYLHHACYHADYWMLRCNQTGQDSGYRRSMQEGIAQDSFSVLKTGSIRNGTVDACEATGYELTTGITKKKEMMMETSMLRKTSIKMTVLHLHEMQRWPNLWEFEIFKHVKKIIKFHLKKLVC